MVFFENLSRPLIYALFVGVLGQKSFGMAVRRWAFGVVSGRDFGERLGVRARVPGLWPRRR